MPPAEGDLPVEHEAHRLTQARFRQIPRDDPVLHRHAALKIFADAPRELHLLEHVQRERERQARRLDFAPGRLVFFELLLPLGGRRQVFLFRRLVAENVERRGNAAANRHAQRALFFGDVVHVDVNQPAHGVGEFDAALGNPHAIRQPRHALERAVVVLFQMIPGEKIALRADAQRYRRFAFPRKNHSDFLPRRRPKPRAVPTADRGIDDDFPLDQLDLALGNAGKILRRGSSLRRLRISAHERVRLRDELLDFRGVGPGVVFRGKIRHVGFFRRRPAPRPDDFVRALFRGIDFVAILRVKRRAFRQRHFQDFGERNVLAFFGRGEKRSREKNGGGESENAGEGNHGLRKRGKAEGGGESLEKRK